MKLSNQALLDSVPVLRKLNQLELPIKVAFIVMKNIKTIEKELIDYVEAREGLIKEYAVLNQNEQPVTDDHGMLQFKEGCHEKWNADIQELLGIEVDVKLQKLSAHDLFKTELSLTPSELSMIEFMIKEW